MNPIGAIENVVEGAARVTDTATGGMTGEQQSQFGQILAQMATLPFNDAMAEMQEAWAEDDE